MLEVAIFQTLVELTLVWLCMVFFIDRSPKKIVFRFIYPFFAAVISANAFAYLAVGGSLVWFLPFLSMGAAGFVLVKFAPVPVREVVGIATAYLFTAVPARAASDSFFSPR